MKPLITALALSTALTAPGLTDARPLTLTTTMNDYGGGSAYLALYVTDPQGAYVGSLWMAGSKSKYYDSLSGWYRATGGDPTQVSGITGASVGAGRTLEITPDLADALFDAGYKTHVDVAVEDMRDDFAEIAERKQPGGLCSGQLWELKPGESVTAFLRANPAFHAGRGRTPLSLIGAGTGIGPLAGFMRADTHRRPVHLFFGLCHAASDFLYREELHDLQEQGRLTGLSTAQSRGPRPHHVQDAQMSTRRTDSDLMRVNSASVGA